MSTYSHFRISVIDGAIEILRHRTKYPETDVETAVRQLRIGPSHLAELDYEAAIQLAQAVGWDAFHPNQDRRTELCETLMDMALRTKPIWAHVSVHGRDKARSFLNEDQLQCLEYAGLLDMPPTEHAIRWWDKLATVFRTSQNERNLNSGREGERLTIEFEETRLKQVGILDRHPNWISIDNNNAGYDVLSYDFDDTGKVRAVKIEVKASASEPINFFITRGEWNTAIREQPFYKFYIWDLESTSVHILSVEQLKHHIPVDSGGGRWVQVEVPLEEILTK